MTSTIRIYDTWSKEMDSLVAFTAMANAFSEDIKYTVKETYFDYGQDWKWMTVIAHRIGDSSVTGSWQALSPAQQERIIYSETPTQIAEVVEEILERNKNR